MRFQRLTGEQHRLKLQLLPELRRERVRGLQRIKPRRGLAQDTDLFPDQQRVEIFGRPRHRLGNHHEAPTG